MKIEPNFKNDETKVPLVKKKLTTIESYYGQN